MKNLLLDSCTKTALSFDNGLYEQCDGVSMGSFLGPVLANIILTEFENVIVKPLIETSVRKFYCRYIDDTLVMIKKDKIQYVLNSFNSFDKNLRFTINTFDDGNIHFLDIKNLNHGEKDIHKKDTNTGLYVQYHSYEHWNTKIAWVRSLYDRTQKIFSNQHLFMMQVNYLKAVMSWNGYPYYIRTKIIKQLQTKQKGQQKNDDQDKKNLPVIFCRIRYAGAQGDRIVKNLTKKLKRIISQPFISKNISKTTKMSYYCNTKEEIPDYLKSHVVYEFCCPACNIGYIGKTDRNLGTWIKEHCGLDKNSAIFNHLAECNFYWYALTLHSFPCDGDETLTYQNILGHIITTVTDNMRIIGKTENWDELCFLESLNIKWKKPSLNTGIKPTKELVLFL